MKLPKHNFHTVQDVSNRIPSTIKEIKIVKEVPVRKESAD
jgi:hypothetical protein